jgi:hypothetical protein
MTDDYDYGEDENDWDYGDPNEAPSQQELELQKLASVVEVTLTEELKLEIKKKSFSEI